MAFTLSPSSKDCLPAKGVSVTSIYRCENMKAQLPCLGEEGTNSGVGAVYSPEVSWDEAEAGTSLEVYIGLASPFLCPAPW